MDFTKQKWFCATVYKNQDFIHVGTYSGYSSIAIDPDGIQTLLPLDVSDEELGQVTLLALSKSRVIDVSEIGTFFNIDNIKKRYDAWVADLMAKYNYKTKRALFKNMMRCYVEISDGRLTISPSWHEKLEAWSGEGISDDDKVVLSVNSTTEEIGAGLRLAFSRCR